MKNEDMVRQLVALGELRLAGALTEEEFVQAKARVLGRADGPTGRLETGHTPTPSASAAPTPQAPASVPSAITARPVRPTLSATPTLTMIAFSGSVLTLLAFTAMPLVSVPIFGSTTGFGAISYSSQVGGLWLLVLIPMAAVIVAGISAWQQWGPPGTGLPMKTAAITTALLAGIGTLVYLIALIRLADVMQSARSSRIGISVFDFVSAGFWLGLLGMIVAAVAAVMASRKTSPPI